MMEEYAQTRVCRCGHARRRLQQPTEPDRAKRANRAPGDDAAAGRRSDAGDVYVIYGNNFGSNR